MSIFNRFKKQKKENHDLRVLRLQIASIKDYVINIEKHIQTASIYQAIGMPIPPTGNFNPRVIELLTEARIRGYFSYDAIFAPVGMNFHPNNYYRHNYSNIPDNYWYDEHQDVLKIPAISLDKPKNICVNIYKKGEWAIVIKDENINI